MNITNKKLIVDLFSAQWTEENIAESLNIEQKEVHDVLVDEGIIVEDGLVGAGGCEVQVQMTLQEFDELNKCKAVIDTIFDAAELNLNDNERIFVNSKYLLRALCMNFPNRVRAKTKELNEAPNRTNLYD